MLTTNDQRIIVSDRHGHLATSYPGRGYTEHEPGHFPERHSSVRSALALGLRILRAQRNHYRQSRPAWACWCGLDTPLLKTDQCADHAPSGAYMSDRW